MSAPRLVYLLPIAFLGRPAAHISQVRRRLFQPHPGLLSGILSASRRAEPWLFPVPRRPVSCIPPDFFAFSSAERSRGALSPGSLSPYADASVPDSPELLQTTPFFRIDPLLCNRGSPRPAGRALLRWQTRLLFAGTPMRSLYVGRNGLTLNSQEAFCTPSVVVA